MWTTLRQFAARLRAFFRAGDLDDDFEQELASHVAMLADENERRGMPPDAARRAAALRVGGTASLAALHREARGLPALDAIVQDVRFACRLLAKERWFAATAIAALALGIGANTAGFAIVNGAFFRGLPFEEADRLYTLSWQNRSSRRSQMSYLELEDWRAAAQSFEALAAYRDDDINISDRLAMPEQVHATWMTANAFDVLRQRPVIGRGFIAADERPGAQPVAIIGEELWQRRFGGGASVIGQELRLNGEPATIVGVMAAGMRFPEDSELWMPLIPSAAERQRSARALRVFGRLRPGVDRGAATTEMSGLAQQMLAADAAAAADFTGVRVETFVERYIGGGGRSMLFTVMGAATFVLLIACANVASLLLSRSAARAREVAVRHAMGATRARIVLQLLLESLVLSVIGSAAGLLLASAGVDLFALAMRQSGLPYWVVFELDATVFWYTTGVCVVTAILFGLAPALHVSKSNNNRVLLEGGRGSVGSARVRRFGNAMVVAEVALTIVLLAGAGVMIRSFARLYSTDLGIRTGDVVTMQLQLPQRTYSTAEARRAFFDQVETQVASVPGVTSVAVTNGVPPRDGGERLLELDVHAGRGDVRAVFVGTVTISPRFFETLGVSLLRGRYFDERDGAPGAETVIINELLATTFFPGEDPLGRRLRFTRRDARPDQPADVWRTIVGIVPLVKHGSPQDGYINSVVYIPYRQEAPGGVSLLVRSALAPESIMDAVRREVQQIDQDQPVLSLQTVEQFLSDQRWWYRTWSGMFGSLAAIALILATVGLYAVIAYSVTQRTQEIGVRMALGAARRAVSWMILRRAVAQLAAGLVLGLPGAWLLTHILWDGGLAALTPGDPATYIGITALLLTVCVAAALIPARRATRIDPLIALREE